MSLYRGCTWGANLPGLQWFWKKMEVGRRDPRFDVAPTVLLPSMSRQWERKAMMTRAEMEQEAAKIKPCPFCGRKARVRVTFAKDGRDYYSLGCRGTHKECFASEEAIVLAFPLEEAANQLEMWNRRA